MSDQSMDILPTHAEQSSLYPVAFPVPLPETEGAADPPLSSPPVKPRLVVRVGVTGHRALPKKEIARLEKQVGEVLRQIAHITQAIYEQRESTGLRIYSAASPGLRLISPLAEGADQLVARQALALNFELQCPLPFFQEEYEQDFKARQGHPDDSTQEFRDLLAQAAGNILELDGSRSAGNQAYEAVGRLVLRQSDVLIAIWDDQHDQGRESQGGTRQIVREALGLEIPTIWISSRVDQVPCTLRSLEPLRVDPLNSLESRLRQMFLFAIEGEATEAGESQEQKIADHRTREIRAAEELFQERAPDRDYSFPFLWYRDFWCWDWEENPSLPEPDWKSLFDKRPRFRAHLDQSYEWSDRLANYYSGTFRSSFVSAYLAGAFAVLFAFLGFYSSVFAQQDLEYLPRFFFALELLLIIAAISLTFMGRRKGWHHRWMDYRLLAESLRQVQFLAPLGRITLSFKVPAHLQPGDPRNSWFNWYFRAFVRDHGMIRARFDDCYLNRCKHVLQAAIQKQIEYHDNNSERLETLSRRSRRSAQSFFILAGIACFLHLLPEEARGEIGNLVLNLATIVLPAFGAALAAISHHGDFERLALRSDALSERLRRLQRELTSGKEPISSRELGRIAESFSEIMFSENLDWRFAFLEKNLELPA